MCPSNQSNPYTHTPYPYLHPYLHPLNPNAVPIQGSQRVAARGPRRVVCGAVGKIPEPDAAQRFDRRGGVGGLDQPHPACLGQRGAAAAERGGLRGLRSVRGRGGGPTEKSELERMDQGQLRVLQLTPTSMSFTPRLASRLLPTA